LRHAILAVLGPQPMTARQIAAALGRRFSSYLSEVLARLGELGLATRVPGQGYAWATGPVAPAPPPVARRTEAERNALVLQWQWSVHSVLRRYWHLASVRRHFEECRSEGFLALVRAAGAWDEEGKVPFGPFAFLCVRRAVLATAFGGRRRPPVLFSELARDDEDRPFDPADPATVGAEEDREHLAASLDRLPARQRRVLALRYGLYGEDGRRLEAVGEALGLTKQRAHQIEAEALRRLRRELDRLEGAQPVQVP
jgi:RNA polymerase sigma factor (sigma-70 family)